MRDFRLSISVWLIFVRVNSKEILLREKREEIIDGKKIDIDCMYKVCLKIRRVSPRRVNQFIEWSIQLLDGLLIFRIMNQFNQ